MNKKFIVGLSSIAVAGTFFGCGEGDVFKLDDDDSLASVALQDASVGEGMIANAMADCKISPECLVLIGDVPAAPVSSSSAAQQQQPQQPEGISSAQQQQPPQFRSSSSKPVFASSDSQGPTSSSAAVIVGGTGDIGTCAPTDAVISKGGSTTWKFTFNGKNSLGLTPKDIIAYDFNWNFGANASKPSEVVTGLSPTSAITYANSGTAKTTLSITKGTAAYSVTCSDLQVNGAPITGCKCAATAATADVADGGIAGWTVAGCVSTGANIIGYEWTGAVGAGESATHTFTEKGQTLAPTVKVSNDDNTVEVVACDVVTAVDASSPDYLFEIEGQLPQSAIEVKNKGCMTISGTWNNPGYNPNIQVLCDMTATSSPVSFKMTYGDKVYETVGAQSWGFSNQGGAIGQLTSGTVKFDNICVEFSGAEFVKCKVQ